MAKAASTQIYGPPQFSPMTDEAWRQWFTNVVWPLIGKGIDNSGNQGSFPQLQVGKARFTNGNAFQELINVDQGIYVTYSSAVQNIIYGFACNVHRSGGNALVVGAQINAYGEGNSTGAVYGLATTSSCVPNAQPRGITGYEMDIGSMVGSNQNLKYGIYNVFKDRGDGQANTTEALGSNYFNYAAFGMVFDSQARSGTGEYCGWTVGIDFIDGWCDQSSVPAWSSSATYQRGMIVSSGGVLWKCITPNTNQTPAGGSAYWVQRTASGTSSLAVGIDFSSMSIASMALMASAIRLRSTQLLHWEETGSVGTYYDAVAGSLHLASNSGSNVFAVNVTNGEFTSSHIGTSAGGGPVATNPTVGGSGPTTAASAGWWSFLIGNTTRVWVPVWT